MVRFKLVQPLLVWVGAAAIAAVVGWWSLSHMSLPTVIPWRGFPDALWLDGFARWDSFWYRTIADGGYGYSLGDQSNFAFFPGYAIAMWGAGTVLGNLNLGGILMSSAFAVGSLYVFRGWLRATVPNEAHLGVVVALALGPSSFYLAGVAYSESLFLLSALGAFLLLERGRPLAAGLVAIPALITRPVGVALAIGLVLRSLELVQSEEGASLASRMRAWISGPQRWVLVAVVGLGIYPVYLWVTAGDPFLFIRAGTEGWNHGVDLETILKTRTSTANLYPGYAAVVGIQTAILVVASVALMSVKRVFGNAYMAFSAVAFLLPTIVRPTILGTGRYVLVAFPVVAAVAVTLKHDLPRTRFFILACSIAAFVVQFSLFSRWYFVG